MRTRTRTHVIVGIGTLCAGAALYVGNPRPVWPSVDLRILGRADEWMVDWDMFMTLFASLFAIMNPIIGVPLFTAMTDGRSAARRRKLAAVASGAVFVVLAVAAVSGTQLLALFAIGIPSFRIAGGVIVLLMGLTMLQASAATPRGRRADDAETATSDSQAICPLAIPLLAGPGAIATVILTCQEASRPCDYVTLAAVVVAMVALVYGTLRAAGTIARVLGPTGLMVVTRLIGMILAAIAMDMAISGVKGAFPGLA